MPIELRQQKGSLLLYMTTILGANVQGGMNCLSVIFSECCDKDMVFEIPLVARFKAS